MEAYCPHCYGVLDNTGYCLDCEAITGISDDLVSDPVLADILAVPE